MKGELKPKAKARIAMIALLVPRKNHLGLMQVISIITKQYKNAEFLIVGDGETDYSNELKKMVIKYNIQDYVRFMGYVKDIPSLLESVDLLIHTTEKEPFGRVFIEAMSAFKPVIAFDSGGASEIVANDETGFLIPNGEINTMAEATYSLINDPSLREKMGRAGRARVEQYYSINKHCQRVAEVYDDLL